jgi:hypothetical protein
MILSVAIQENPRLVDGVSAAALLGFDGTAYVVTVYDGSTLPVSDQVSVARKRRKSGGSNKNGGAAVYFGGLKVLVVGSRNLNEYRHALERAGAVVETINPYEENLELLSGAFSRAHIVLVCVQHVPHTTYGYVNTKSPNVEKIHNDRTNVLIARARYIAIRLGLI